MTASNPLEVGDRHVPDVLADGRHNLRIVPEDTVIEEEVSSRTMSCPEACRREAMTDPM